MPWLPSILAMATAAVPHLTAARADKPPVLDGLLDDPVWQRATPADTFTQKFPSDGKPPGDRTVVRILYDDDNIYVGFDCPQSVEVVARLTRRDRQVETDAVAVIFDTRGDGKSAFEFQVSAAGVLSDGLHFNDTDFNQDWDENWEAKVARRKGGWSAEMRIPLRALRFPTKPVQSWGLQLKRYVSARQELDEWSHIPRETAAEVSGYGRLDDLVGLRSKTAIEIAPFIAAGIRHYDPLGTVLARGFLPTGSVGFDLRWHVNQALTLNAAVLPDFGQVEADQVILNLTTYEIYYPEKRPFFLEGFDTFSTPMQLLYTRRIGAVPPAPVLNSYPPYGEQLVDLPTPSTIYTAAKLVGDLGDHWSMGELVAVTGRNTVTAQALNGAQVQRLADPLTTYKVFRLKRELSEGAYVGAMFTATNRLENAFDYPLVPGVTPGYSLIPGIGPDVAGLGNNGRALQLCPLVDNPLTPTLLSPGSRCFHDAYVFGVDGRWRSPSGDYNATAQVIASAIEGGPPRLLPDGTVIKSGDVGPAVSVKAAKDGGKLVGNVEYDAYGKDVDYNDLGFMPRQNLQKAVGQIGYRHLDPSGPTLETHTAFEVSDQEDLSWQVQQRSFRVFNFTKFKNFWGMFTDIHFWPAHFDDREVGDGAALERASVFGFEVWLGTDSRKRVSAQLWTQTHFLGHAFAYQGDGKVTLKILPQWDVDLAPNWVYTTGEPRYFTTQGSAYLFGRQRAQSLSLTLRSTYTFTPTLTLQAYAQAILESEHFSDYMWFPARGAGTAIFLADLRPVGFPVLENPDFEAGTINANLVLRWEYRLGSTLFLVYTHSQNNGQTPSFGDGAGFNFTRIAPRPADDALLGKLSYWWG
jgi:Domain of unknown function (DUF5916)/Carbohydrate family 9 binding domain-like